MPKDVRGTWHLQQSNGPMVTLHINEDPDGTFGGNSTAEFDGITGTIDDARATDDEITFRVPWSKGPVGRYVGRFDLQGRLTGITFAEGSPAEQATWVVEEKTFGPYQ